MARAKRVLIAPEAKSQKRITTLDPDTQTDPKDHNTPATRRALASVDRRQKFVTLSDQIAKEVLFFRNYKWPGANRAYPDDIDCDMRFVTKYYPHTDGGKPLYVDEPMTEREMVKAYEKQKVLKKLGMRHLVIDPTHLDSEGKSIPGSTLSDCLEQLGED